MNNENAVFTFLCKHGYFYSKNSPKQKKDLKSIYFFSKYLFRSIKMVDDIGLEPMTFRTSSGCSSQLS